MDFSPRGSDYLWRFSSHFSKNKDFITQMRRWWLEFQMDNAAHRASPQLFWDTAKAVLSGHLMSYVKRLKRLTSEKIKKYSQPLRRAYTDFTSSPSPQSTENWQTAKWAYEVWLDGKESSLRTIQEARLFRFGNKAGRLLASFEKRSLYSNPY